MADPITGPHVLSYGKNISGEGSWWVYRARFRQKPPYELALTYYTHAVYTTAALAGGTVTVQSLPTNAWSGYGPEWIYALDLDKGNPQGHPWVGPVLQIARERFMAKVNELQSEWLASALQFQQTLDMVHKRLKQLSDFLKGVATRNPRLISKSLGIPVGRASYGLRVARRRKPDLVTDSRLKNLSGKTAGTVLEFQFGWMPLVSDIVELQRYLASACPEVSIVGRKTTRYENTYRNGSETSVSSWAQNATHKTKVTCAVGASLRIDNPNLLLLNNLGVTNPFLTAWQVVPFSFLVDMVVNTSEFFQQYSELHGVTLVAPYHNFRLQDICEYNYSTSYWGPIPPTPNGGSGRVVSYRVSFRRVRGLPSWQLRTKPFFTNAGKVRTTLTLLVQQLANLR